MTLDDLLNHLINKLHVSQSESVAAIEATAKIIAFKYEAELYKVFTTDDIRHANTLNEKNSFSFLRSRYQEITGQSTDILLSNITHQAVSSIIQNPLEYFKFASQE